MNCTNKGVCGSCIQQNNLGQFFYGCQYQEQNMQNANLNAIDKVQKIADQLVANRKPNTEFAKALQKSKEHLGYRSVRDILDFVASNNELPNHNKPTEAEDLIEDPVTDHDEDINNEKVDSNKNECYEESADEEIENTDNESEDDIEGTESSSEDSSDDSSEEDSSEASTSDSDSEQSSDSPGNQQQYYYNQLLQQQYQQRLHGDCRFRLHLLLQQDKRIAS